MTEEAQVLADTHCHLMVDEFEDDRQAVLDRARQAGVQILVIPGIDLGSSRQAVCLAEANQGVYAAVGIHPQAAETFGPESLDRLRELASSDKVVAVGEIGLDYYRDAASPSLQRRAFKAQLDLAAELSLPVIVHQRDSLDDVLRILERWQAGLIGSLTGRAGVLHAFSGDAAAAGRATSLGFYLGIGGVVTFRNAHALKSLIPDLSLARLVTETDSPYLAPHPHRGRRNEPAYTRLVAEELSALLGVPYSVIAHETFKNASTLFGWNNGIGDSNLL